MIPNRQQLAAPMPGQRESLVRFVAGWLPNPPPTSDSRAGLLVSLYVTHYNLCRVHEALRTTPAKALGVVDRTWSAGL
jgi:hypothetical protein